MRFSILFVNWSFIFLLSWITYNDLNLFSNFWVHLFFPLGAVIILMFYWGPLFAKCLASIISSNSQLLCEEVRDIFPPDIERVMFFPRSHFYLWHQLGVSSDTSYPELASVTGLRAQSHKTVFSSDANYKYQVTERLSVNWGSHNPILRFDGSPKWLTAQNSTVLTITGLLWKIQVNSQMKRSKEWSPEGSWVQEPLFPWTDLVFTNSEPLETLWFGSFYVDFIH